MNHHTKKFILGTLMGFIGIFLLVACDPAVSGEPAHDNAIVEGINTAFKPDTIIYEHSE